MPSGRLCGASHRARKSGEEERRDRRAENSALAGLVIQPVKQRRCLKVAGAEGRFCKALVDLVLRRVPPICTRVVTPSYDAKRQRAARYDVRLSQQKQRGVARPESAWSTGCAGHALRRLRACHPSARFKRLTVSRARTVSAVRAYGACGETFPKHLSAPFARTFRSHFVSIYLALQKGWLQFS
jgi:hypothetical protein